MARFWRLIGMHPLGDSRVVAASAIQLLSSSGLRLDANALLSLVGASPLRGAVNTLQSDDFTQECAWEHAKPGVSLLWDFGAGNDAQVAQVLLCSGAQQAEFLSRFVLQSSDDEVLWATAWSLSGTGLRWPGAFVSSGAIPVGSGGGNFKARVLAPLEDASNIAQNLVSGVVLEPGGSLTSALGGLRGGRAASFDGSSARLSMAGNLLDLANNDWAVDFWKFTVSIDRNHCFLRGDAGGLSVSPEQGLSIRHDANYFVVSVNGGSIYRILSTSAKSRMVAGRWQHIAVSREGGALRLFIDGVLAEQLLINGPIDAVAAWRIGYDSYTPSNSLQGLLQDYRVTVGKALFTEDFVPDAQGIRPDTRFLGTPITGTLSEAASISFGENSFSLAHDAATVLDTEFGGVGRVYGTVSRKATPANTPLVRRVRLHRSRDGLLVRETWSKPDGSYAFTGISPRYEYDVIAWDHEMNEYSAIANNQRAEVAP